MSESLQNETLPQPKEALERLLAEIEANGLMNLIELDAYFGHVTLPFEKEIDVLSSTYGEAFSFFTDLLNELREEMEIHFETTEMYEDEEFEQFEEDCRIIKARYTDMFKEGGLDKLRALAQNAPSA